MKKFNERAVSSRVDRAIAFDPLPKIPTYQHRSDRDHDADYHSGPRVPLPPEAYMNATAAKPNQTYSGAAIRGIATMHKSNAVPVSNEQNPTDYATMRRNR